MARYTQLNEQVVILELMTINPNAKPIAVDLKRDKLQIIGKIVGYMGKI